MNTRFTLLLAAGLAAPLISLAQAPNWPAKPVHMIVSQAPGSAPDIICRLLTDRLSRALGQPVIVDNRPGAANVIGTQAAARSAPDGYNFLFATAAALTTNRFTTKDLPYDPIRDFTPVSMIAKGAFVLVANAKVPAKNLTELVALDKAQPGRFSMAVDGPRFFTGMLTSYMNKAMGTSFVIIPYTSPAQGVTDTVSGQAQVTIQPPVVVDPFIKRGELKPLALSSARRYPSMPDVPTMAETFPGFEMVGWFMMVAPTGTPADIVQRMNREMDKILKEPEIQSRLRDFAFFSDGAETPATLAEFLRSETALWAKVVKTVGVEPE